MKKKLLSIVLCFALVAGCCVAFTPATVQAKKFSKKKVKFVMMKPTKSFYLPEDDIATKNVLLIINKNSKRADVEFDVCYYKGKGANKKLVYTQKHSVYVTIIAYIGIGNEEGMPKFSSFKIKHKKIKKAKGKIIPMSKVQVKKLKKQDGNTRISMKNNSKYDGVFEIVLVYYNKKGKPVYLSSTTPWELKKGKETKIFFEYKPKGVKYKKIKGYYNFFKCKI